MTQQFDFAEQPHRRRNPLTGDWVLVSPHRNKRPWQGQLEAVADTPTHPYDATCYLCPGNERMGGAKNPAYGDTFVFDNDFPALTRTTQKFEQTDNLFSVHAEQGECRVISYSPDHSKSLAELSPTQIEAVIRCWIEQASELGKEYAWVQIFENKGEVMGCSMPHPHGQVWAQHHAPTLLQREDAAQLDYHAANNASLLLDYAQREVSAGSRIVVSNDDWAVVVPFWAAWPFETLLLPLFPVTSLVALTARQQQSLAAVMSQLLIRYDNLFTCAFPYSMGWHGAPSTQAGADQTSHWQLHAHFYPPLLRSSSVRKFMVGYEMMAEAQRDLTAEQAASILRDLPAAHYKSANA